MNFSDMRPMTDIEYQTAIKAHNRRLLLKKEAIAAYGGKCIRCGFKDIRALCLDHIHNDRADNLAGHNLILWLREQGYPKDDFQILCANCNAIKAEEVRSYMRDNKLTVPKKYTPTASRKRGLTPLTPELEALLSYPAPK